LERTRRGHRSPERRRIRSCSNQVDDLPPHLLDVEGRRLAEAVVDREDLHLRFLGLPPLLACDDPLLEAFTTSSILSPSPLEFQGPAYGGGTPIQPSQRRGNLCHGE
jgi:hypothetical protein